MNKTDYERITVYAVGCLQEARRWYNRAKEMDDEDPSRTGWHFMNETQLTRDALEGLRHAGLLDDYSIRDMTLMIGGKVVHVVDVFKR